MAGPEAGTRSRPLAEFVAEHRDQLERYADSDRQTALIAEAALCRARADAQTNGGGQR